ncbi:hypothetical protein BC628DRAFT_1441564 [Trametes gibbosa]|nr:hypothetical protein BC628DRAFT_1441564 [Trametes gibbosa]
MNIGPFIIPLPAWTQSKLRSTQIITSLIQLISELVQNSLDAGARSVDVSLDAEEWECSVRDDGTGISRDGLGVLTGSHEPGRYGTSKAYTLASLDEVTSFGFRGEALASIADIACLEISSRTLHSRESWSIILKGGQTLYSGPAIRWRREFPGTVVSVRDAFFNLPIRRRSHPNAARTVELVKREIESFALVLPNVTFSLETMRRRKDDAYARTKTRILNVPKTGSTLAAFRHIYGRALADHVEQLDESYSDMHVDGFISLQGAYSKAYQFIYINKHLLATCDLHRHIEALYARSSFSKKALEELGKTCTPAHTVRRSPRKTEKKAVYVLNLTISPRFVDNCVEPAKAAVQLQNSAAAVTFLTSVVERVLVQHGFLVERPQPSQPSYITRSPRKKRKLSHDENEPRLSQSTHPSSARASESTSGPSNSRSSSTYRPPSRSLYAISEDDIVTGSIEDVSEVLWTDSTTGERFVIDTRTGNSYPHVPQTAPALADTSATPTAPARITLGSRTRLSTTADTPAWISDALHANETYRLTERRILTLPSCVELMEHRVCDPSQIHKNRKSHTRTDKEVSWDAPRLARFTSADLRGARVLGQVDRKFIACVIRRDRARGAHQHVEGVDCEDDEGIGTLVLIDQHAADERVRVERFLDDLCGPRDGSGGLRVRARELTPPVNVLLTTLEARTIAESPGVRSAFGRWGIAFAPHYAARDDHTTLPIREDMAAYAQVAVTTVPEVVADKLLAGEELRELIKGYLAKLESDGIDLEGTRPQHDGDLQGWQRALRYCPRELVDLVNSKACRGAIMFNDSLTADQCKTLLDKLSATALPFQCAHGRPSLVPLVEVCGPARQPTRSDIDWSAFVSSRIP